MRRTTSYIFGSASVLRIFAYVFAAWLFFSNAAPGLGAGPLVNDVGRGAFLWGTSSERTTYLRPYNALMAPEIKRIPEDNLKEPLGPGVDRTTLWKTSQEVGTVIGTDGRVYRYHYERGVEPRRVVEKQTVGGRTVDVERTVWDPVLIRVLEPYDKKAEKAAKEAAEKARAAANSPQPCAPIGPCEALQNRADAVANAPTQDAARQAAGNPDADPSQQPTLTQGLEIADPSAPQRAASQPPAESAGSDDDATTVTFISYDPKYAPAEKAPIVLSPKGAR